MVKFVDEKAQARSAMTNEEREELLMLFRNAPGDFKNLLLGNYGRLPVGWPAEWVYQSAFGEEWAAKIKDRKETSPLESVANDDLGKLRRELEDNLGRAVTDEEFVLYLMHPKDALEYLSFRDPYG